MKLRNTISDVLTSFYGLLIVANIIGIINVSWSILLIPMVIVLLFFFTTSLTIIVLTIWYYINDRVA